MFAERRIVPSTGLNLDAFEVDAPKMMPALAPAREIQQTALIAGVEMSALTANEDDRGALFELLTTRDGMIEPIVHVYQVVAAPGSIRAWVYHQHQFDRLAFTDGDLELVLYDLRPGSATLHHINVLRVGQDQPCLVRIPPFVIHGLRNRGTERAYFTNLPTNVYRRDRPDKCRLPYDDPRIPYTFE